MAADRAEPLGETPLTRAHEALGARMVPFAGYVMPVQYEGIIAEHRWTRESAGLFDVSHMGQAFLVGPDHETAARALEALVPADILGLRPGQVRYTQLTGDDGGTLDDLMVSRSHAPEDDGRLYLVVNASRKREDYAHIAERLPAEVRLAPVEDRALIALQGPAAEAVIAPLSPDAAELKFMRARSSDLDGIDCHLARSGYTGEDGFEISVAANKAVAVWDRLIENASVRPIGLGARDSLRLEAGLCLYGNDLDETISPVEAGLAWSIQKRRRAEGGFPGADRILREIAEGPPRKRVGIRPSDRTPARHGTQIETPDGRPIGTVTSGGFGPTVGGPIAMGLIEAGLADEGREIVLKVRGRPVAAKIVPLPFVPARYKR